jgi:hypothetical protein
MTSRCALLWARGRPAVPGRLQAGDPDHAGSIGDPIQPGPMTFASHLLRPSRRCPALPRAS